VRVLGASAEKLAEISKMASFILGTVKSQLPMLIEKFEPALESGLRSSLKAMKEKHPDEAKVFLTNWAKLDAAVKSELGPPTGARRRGGKRTRRNKSKKV